jgi:hypothetical protein
MSGEAPVRSFRSIVGSIACAVTIAAAPAVMVVAVSSGTAGADQFDVTNNHDSGAGSLRQALIDAQNHAGPDDVVADTGIGTITLTSGPLSWNGGGSVSIDGAGLTINANGNPQVLFDAAGDGVSVLDITITGMGGAAASEDAGAIVSEGGEVNVRTCTITNNTITSTGEDAGAILSEGGAMSVENCTITNNTISSTDGDVGALLSEGGALDVEDSTISHNTLTAEDEDVAALLSEGGALTVSGSNVDANAISTGEGDAGAIVSEGGALEITDTTVSGNGITSDDGDAGTIASEGGALAIVDSTVVLNTAVGTEVAAGGAHAHGSTRVSGSLIACNTAHVTGGESLAAGALAILGESLTLIDSTIQGNTASASGGGTAVQQIFFEGTINNTNSQIIDSTAGCTAPSPTPTPEPIPTSPAFTG